MRIAIACCLGLVLMTVGCERTQPTSETDVVAFLAKADPALRAQILTRAGLATASAPPPVPKRTDLIARGDQPLTLRGTQPDIGDIAPDAVLKGDGMVDVKLSDYRGKTLLVSVVPSIDTRVCELQTHRMTDEQPNLPPNTALLTVSRDLPFAQTRFVESVQVQTTMASDFDGGAFGKAWGLEVAETGLLARSVWVLDPTGKVTYRQLVADQGDEPDYAAAFTAAADTARASATGAE